MADPYTAIRGDDAPEKPIRYLLSLDYLDEGIASYKNPEGATVTIKRDEYETRGKPMEITLILGKE
jgi:hypothetical protein